MHVLILQLYPSSISTGTWCQQLSRSVSFKEKGEGAECSSREREESPGKDGETKRKTEKERTGTEEELSKEGKGGITISQHRLRPIFPYSYGTSLE